MKLINLRADFLKVCTRFEKDTSSTRYLHLSLALKQLHGIVTSQQ